MSEAGTLCKVLIVEDDNDIQDLLVFMLQHVGYACLRAGNGREALRVLESEKPALILLDLMMPVMDGMEFLEHQKLDPRIADIPVIVLSAAAQAHMMESRIGAGRVMRKPFDIEIVLKAVKTHCG
jgi:two-component system response regulator VicR